MQTLELFARSPRELAIAALHEATAIYTCEPVVDALLDRIRWPAGSGALVDTSCGDGSFLGRALLRLLQLNPRLSGEELVRRISGWEIHPDAAHQARERLSILLQDHGTALPAAQRLAARIVTCGDFLTQGPRDGAYQAIVGNPPYLRFTNVPHPLRAEYEAILPAHARADLLHSFLDRCAQLLGPDGELAMVTADRWMFNTGAARLREAIGRRFRLAHAERLDVASTFYRPKQRRAGTPPRIHPCAIVLKANEGAPITCAPIFPGSAYSGTADAGGLTLSSLAQIRLAPWLGTPGIFLVDAGAAAGLPGDHLIPAVDTDDIRQGVLQPASRRAILTRPDVQPPATVLAHLEREMPRMCARGRRRGPHWVPPEPFHGFDLSAPSLLVPRITRSLRPVALPAGVLPVNHNISIIAAPGASLDTIAAILATPAADEWMRHVAAPLENGYRAVTARLLRQMPVSC